MGETVVLEHIRSWQTTGLIDEPTAARLRAAEAMEAIEAVDGGEMAVPEGRRSEPFPSGEHLPPASEPAVRQIETLRPLEPIPAQPVGDRTPIRLPALADGLSAVEVLVYLGVALVAAAWYWELAAQAPEFGTGRASWFAIGTAIPAALAAVAGLALRVRSGRLGRSAGVLFLASGIQVAFVGYFLADFVRPGGDLLDLTIGAGLWVVAAVAFRRLVAGTATAAGVVAAIVVTGLAAEEWLRTVLFGQTDWMGETTGGLAAPGPLIPLLGAAWWLAVALALGVVAEAESRSADAGASRRASLVRGVSGLVAVLGVAGSLLGTGWPTGEGMIDRLDPFVGDGAVLVVSAALVALAGVTAGRPWLYPAALGIVIALSDLNARYLSEALGMAGALLVEGAILIAVGVATESARRRLTSGRTLRPRVRPAGPPAPSAPASSPRSAG